MSRLIEGGQCGALVRSLDWSGNSLGAIAAWPQSLTAAINLMLNSSQPMFVAWGPELNFIYNDGYAPILGGRHPSAMGRPFKDVWPEIWHEIWPLIEKALSGQATWMENMHLVMERHGAPENTWYTFSYSPLFDDTGAIGGMVCSCIETTAEVLAQRLADFRLALDSELRRAADPAEAMYRASELLGSRLGAARVGYGDIDTSGEFVLVERDWTDGTIPTVAGAHRMEAFGPAIIAELRANQTMTVDDVNIDPRVNEGAQAFAAISTRSVMAVPLHRFGSFRAMLFIHHHSPRQWSAEDIALAEETLMRTWDAVERARAELLLRSSEERLRFLDELGQATIALTDANEVLAITTKLVGEHLGVTSCAYADMDQDSDGFTIRGDWSDNGSTIVGHYRLADFGELAVERLGAGQPLIINDNEVDIAPHEAATFQAIGIRATICMPLVKNGKLTALMAIHDRLPRRWTDRELTLLLAVTERSWSHIERVGVIAKLAEINRDLEAMVAERTADLMAAEATLRQSQKMEAVGQLTGGLAHDFNNILAGVGGSLDIMARRLEQGRIAEIGRYITGASEAIKRAAAITQRMLAFSRRQTLDPTPTNVAILVEGMIELITRSVGPAVAVSTEMDARLWPTFVDVSQLENALLNLCINARDAMPEGGSLTISGENLHAHGAKASKLGLPEGDYVCLTVADSGTGMTPEVVARAFDPFFTTKPIGRGTGLGLSMVYGFAGQSGGNVEIETDLGVGTRITLYLPRFAGELEAPRPESPGATVETRKTDMTVLLVDDENLIRMAVAEQLRELGFAVLEAPDGPSALRIFEGGADIGLLVTDVGLPNGINGRQLADALRAWAPTLPVLFITGYAEKAVLGHGDLDVRTRVLAKPFTAGSLQETVASLLQ